MSGYELQRRWFDWCFENPEKMNPNHHAIYFFAIEHCNRMGWKQKFGFPTQMSMEALGIKKHGTYIKYFLDLVEWGFIGLVQKSQNQYSANIITLETALPKNGKAMDKAIIKHGVKHTAKQTKTIGQSTGQSNSTIDKPLTINQEPINKEQEVFDVFRVLYQGKKRGNETEFNYFKKHKDWKACLLLLKTGLEKEIAWRKSQELQQAKFIPSWKDLKTWIYNRCWEQEFQGAKMSIEKAPTAVKNKIAFPDFYDEDFEKAHSGDYVDFVQDYHNHLKAKGWIRQNDFTWIKSQTA